MPSNIETRYMLLRRGKKSTGKWRRFLPGQTFSKKSDAECFGAKDAYEYKAVPCTVTTTWSAPGGGS